MEPIKVDLRCDIQGPVRVRYLDGNLFSMDKAANIINVDVFDNGVPVQVGGSVTAEVIRADGGTVTVSGTVSGNRASVTLPQACYAVVGAISVVIKVTEGTTITTIAAFVANVYRSSTDIVVDPGTIIQSVEDLIADIEGAVANIPVAYNASFAPAYSNSSTYAVGQYVTYDGYLWRCTTAITTAESWTSGHWTKVALAEELSDVKSALDENFHIEYTESPGYISSNGTISAQSATTLEVYTSLIPFVYGQTIDFKLVKPNTNLGHWIACGLYDENGAFIERITIENGTLDASIECTIETTNKNCRYISITYRSYGSVADIDFIKTTNSVYKSLVAALKLEKVSENVDILNIKSKDILIPELRNGSAGNPSNANSISTKYIYPIDFTKDSILIEYTGNANLADTYYFGYCLFSGATDGMESTTAFNSSSITKKQYNNNANIPVYKPWFEVHTNDLVGYDHIMFFLFRSKNGTQVPLRIATDQYSLRTTWKNNHGIEYRDIDLSETRHDLLYAKHAKGNTGTRLSLLHFSDLHKDTGALARIMNDAKFFAYDDAICTGDMVDNTYEQIASWWNASVMTCIGNHDSASYSGGVYNWTALSMANRSAYYIEPFESGWGITHTSGKSYYYKDYSDAKVRLIVMDNMLYNDNGQDATDQTTWLSGMLSSAITNDLHVLIAIHAPHGGATAKECSFSRYEQTEMPTHTDCNTPQVVIDTVATAITNGLNFIGYIVGHTHQDNIWDAENNGKQLMYCVTCAAVSNENQWKGSDQHRDTENDAYNIITIDTANTLVKIIRGGGASIDDHMRTRKAICFDYSTGTKVGEVL